MKLEAIEEKKLEKFDVKVNPYLTLAQIQNIINNVSKFNTYAERQETINYMLLCYATDIGQDGVDKLDPELVVTSGLIDAVKDRIINLYDIEDAITYHESVGKALSEVAKSIPQLSEMISKVDKDALHK